MSDCVGRTKKSSVDISRGYVSVPGGRPTLDIVVDEQSYSHKRSFSLRNNPMGKSESRRCVRKLTVSNCAAIPHTWIHRCNMEHHKLLESITRRILNKKHST